MGTVGQSPVEGSYVRPVSHATRQAGIANEELTS